MSENQLDQRKAQFLNWERSLGAQQQLVFRIAAAIDVLMLLWVPKVATVSNPLLGVSESHSIGRSFIFSNPMGDGAGFAAFAGMSVHIDLLMLIFQFVLVNGAAVFLMKYLKNKS
ncbi:MAG TPA: hypothetical protein VG944_01990 [Fimbriimonas sp.]|nr:hypothetical protein [Fimbriimonas sp.]